MMLRYGIEIRKKAAILLRPQRLFWAIVTQSDSNSPNPGRIRCKVCGLTRAEDALALEELGVDFLGFNFWPGSKRYLSPDAAKPIIASLRKSVAVGIFVDHPAAEIHRIARLTGIRYAQLHGAEGWETLDALEIPVIKAIPSGQLDDLAGLEPDWSRHGCYAPEYLLVDSADGGRFGGTGKTFDWSLLGRRRYPTPLFLAGGLNAGNLEAALAAFRPHAVDLNSGVESAPGIKDPSQVRACLEVLRRHDALAKGSNA